MKNKFFSYIIIIFGLFVMLACSKRIEKTVVEREAPSKVIIEQRTAPVVRERVINKKRVVEERTDEFGRPITQHEKTTIEEYDR